LLQRSSQSRGNISDDEYLLGRQSAVSALRSFVKNNNGGCSFVRRLSDSEIEHLIELWRNEECLWKVTCSSFMDNDARRAALTRISQKMGGVDTKTYKKAQLTQRERATAVHV